MRPDLVIVGKALAGGELIQPLFEKHSLTGLQGCTQCPESRATLKSWDCLIHISNLLPGVWCDRETQRFDTILTQNRVGSTMAANPPGCAAALAALDVLEEENLAARAHEMGDLLISTLKSLNPPHVKQYMGDGLLWAIVMQERPPLVTSRRVVPLLAQRGLLANAIKGGRIRICPPLNIDRDLLIKGAEVIVKALVDIESHPQGIPGESVVIRYPQFMQ